MHICRFRENGGGICKADGHIKHPAFAQCVVERIIGACNNTGGDRRIVMHLGSAALYLRLPRPHAAQTRLPSLQAPPQGCGVRSWRCCACHCPPPYSSCQRGPLPGRRGLRCWAAEVCSLCSGLGSMSTARHSLPTRLGPPSWENVLSDCCLTPPESIKAALLHDQMHNHTIARLPPQIRTSYQTAGSTGDCCILLRYVAPQACFRGRMESMTSRAVTTEQQNYKLSDAALADGRMGLGADLPALILHAA